jgi:NAD(P)-dependent dehydrogenase (short-subunit alcohol dehydrogenase family)
MSEFLSSKVLLTGALGTLGTAQAEAFAKAGASLFLLDRPGDSRAAEAIGGLIAGFGAEVRYVGQDLIDLEQTEATVRKLAAEVGGFDILINNAALIINKPFEDFTIVEYEEQVRVNSTAAYVLARAVVPEMKARRVGCIVNFCSITLNGRWDGFAPYVASKGALYGLTKQLARELGPYDIRVNAVSPGAVVSEAEARVFGDRRAEYHDWVLDNQCLKQRIEPRHVADLVLFLCSERSQMITGQNVAIDGGW